MVCHCTLGGSVACESCPNYRKYYGDRAIHYKKPDNLEEAMQKYYKLTNPTPKRIIEKFDEKGNLIERITEG